MTIARALPQSIACLRCAGGRPCAARAMTTALSPERTALISTIWTIEEMESRFIEIISRNDLKCPVDARMAQQFACRLFVRGGERLSPASEPHAGWGAGVGPASG